MKELTLSPTEFKALASQTRVKIIKLLNERNHTLSELAKKLGLASPTIKQHLDTLVGSEIIQQNDEGRKWKYYSLTRKGRNMLQPEQTNVVLLLALSSIAVVGLLIMLGFTLTSSYMTPLGAMGTAQTQEASYNNIAQLPVLETTQAEKDAATEKITDTTGRNTQTLQAQKDPLNIPIIGLIITAIIVFSLLVGLSVGKLKQN
ncbi:MAG: winged helix-turn-helix domain-containing protein [archaeon]|nr:winged helix-turn-helix domain-containing protein [archaeon]